MNVKVKLAAVEDLSISKPEEGKTYVVFRDVETDSRISKYSICVYKDGNWVPEIIYRTHWPNFVGIPVADVDKWINIDDAFGPTDDTIDVQKDSNNELVDIKKIIDDHEMRIQQLERSNTNSLQLPTSYPPYTPYAPVTPGPVCPSGFVYSICTGTPYFKPGEITYTYNVPSNENK